MAFYPNLISFFLCFLSLIFILAGITGWSDEEDDLKAVSWIKSDYNQDTLDDINGPHADLHAGLKALLWVQGSSERITEYAESNCAPDDLCDQCEDAGETSVAFLVLAMIVAIVNLVLTGVVLSSESLNILYGVAGTGVVVVAFLCISFTAFIGGKCWDRFEDAMEGYDQNIEMGPGAVLVLTAMILMIVSVLMNLVSIRTPIFAPESQTPAAPVPTKEEDTA
mmetsp:Transcript_6817/g.11369  ORF Transcript_6817/g.11369 Transcript_6817/m.11369 type:complete len:223 (-) Transcript_6817:992-1660(-)